MNNDAENNDQLKDALRSYGLKHDIARIHTEMMSSMTQPQAPVRSMPRIISRIAAAILVLIIGAGVFIYFNADSQTLFENKFHPYEAGAQRGDAEQHGVVKDKFLNGQEYLRNGDVAKAILTFAEILSINATASEKILNDDAEFYLALSYLRDNQPQNALPLLAKINGDSSHLYHDEVSDFFLLRVRIASWRNH